MAAVRRGVGHAAGDGALGPARGDGKRGNSSATVSWSVPASNGGSAITGYDVYRGTSAGGESATPVATNVTGTSFTDTGLVNGTTYYYTVAAVNAAGHVAAVQRGVGHPAGALGRGIRQRVGSATASRAGPRPRSRSAPRVSPPVTPWW